MAGQMGALAGAGEADQAFLLQVVNIPQLFVGNVGDAPLPEEFVHEILAPGRGEILVEKLGHLIAHPRERVNAVGDGLNPIFPRFQILENVPPHVVADLAVKLADSVAERREMQREDGQAEWLLALAGTRKAEVDELIQRDANILAVLLVVFADQPGIEGFVTRRATGVWVVKTAFFATCLHASAKFIPPLTQLRTRSSPRNALCPSFICQQDGSIPSACSTRTSADAKDEFLADAHLPAADIKLARDRTVGGIILGRIGVQQQHRHAAHLRQPDARVHITVGEIDANREVAAIVTEQRLDGQARKIIRRVEVLLPAVGLNLLFEVAVFIERADADEGNPEVARGLAMIAGEHAEAAGINAQAFVKAKFG